MKYSCRVVSFNSKYRPFLVRLWCNDNFGVDNWRVEFAPHISHYDATYYFNHEEHKTWFILKWL